MRRDFTSASEVRYADLPFYAAGPEISALMALCQDLVACPLVGKCSSKGGLREGRRDGSEMASLVIWMGY